MASGFDFPGVVYAFRLVPERGDLGYCWKGLGNEPLSILGVTQRKSIPVNFLLAYQFAARFIARTAILARGSSAKLIAEDYLFRTTFPGVR
jgi:hypothetical protein